MPIYVGTFNEAGFNTVYVSSVSVNHPDPDLFEDHRIRISLSPDARRDAVAAEVVASQLRNLLVSALQNAEPSGLQVVLESSEEPLTSRPLTFTTPETGRISSRAGAACSGVPPCRLASDHKDHEIREHVNRLTALAKDFGQTQQLRERIAQEVRSFAIR